VRGRVQRGGMDWVGMESSWVSPSSCCEAELVLVGG
jgi:hypothetical protein